MSSVSGTGTPPPSPEGGGVAAGEPGGRPGAIDAVPVTNARYLVFLADGAQLVMATDEALSVNAGAVFGGYGVSSLMGDLKATMGAGILG